MKNITIVAIDFQTHDLTRYGIEQTVERVDAKEVLIISDREILPGAQHIIREPVANMVEYNQVMLKGVAEHINDGHTLFVQWDGMAHDGSQWTDEFLNYDYIGAPWPWEQEGKNVGNGGFSLRSKRLLDACLDNHVQIPAHRNFIAEDAAIGVDHREFLEKTYGIKYAPTELAQRFSFELGHYVPSFGFHGSWNIFNFLDDDDMNFYADRMGYTGWNIYKWHHTLAAVIRRNRMDIYENMLAKMVEHSPELLDPVARWLEADATKDQTNLVIM